MIKTYTLKKVILLFLLLFIGNTVFAQDIMSKAWQAFFENKRNDARNLFNQAIQQNVSAGDALLGLSLLAQVDKPATESFVCY